MIFFSPIKPHFELYDLSNDKHTYKKDAIFCRIFLNIIRFILSTVRFNASFGFRK